MAGTQTNLPAATRRRTRRIHLGRRSAVIIVALAAAVVVNLAVYIVGRAAGAMFTYTQSGKATRVDALAVAFMTVVPLGTGLALVAWLSRRWSALITTAKVVAPLLAVATIAVMTLPARFDTASTLCLATMHLTLVPATLLAIGALDRCGLARAAA